MKKLLALSYLCLLVGFKAFAVIPTIAPSNPIFTSITSQSLTFSWTGGNGGRRIVVCSKDSAPSLVLDYEDYAKTGNPSFGSGAEHGNGFIMYNGTANTVNILNLSPSSIYYFHVYEYDFVGDEYFYDFDSPTSLRMSANATTQATITAPTLIPSGPASAIITDIDSETVNINLSFANKGNGTGRIIVLRPNHAEVRTPTNNFIYQKYTIAQHDAIFSGRNNNSFWVGGRFRSLVMDFGDIQGFNISFKKEGGINASFDVFEYNGNIAAGTAVFNTTPLSFNQNLSSPPVPTIGASELSFTAVTNTSITLNWNNGNGTNRIVIARKGLSANAEPNNGQLYMANSAFGSGGALGNGFVVFNGKGNSVNVTNLEAGANYHFTVIEFNFLPDAITYANSLKSNANRSTVSIESNSDSDADGVNDEEDEFPLDKYKAFTMQYPAAGFGTLMFEDLWTGKGDYDFNDLVLDYKFAVVSSAAGNVVEVNYTFVTRAIGGSLHNGFAFQLDGIPSNRILSVSGAKTDGITYTTFNGNGTESNQTFANIVVIKDAIDLISFMGLSGIINVDSTAPNYEPDTTFLVVKFSENGISPTADSISISDFTPSLFNPYLIIGQDRGKEVHLPNRVPSSLANLNYFGKDDDNSIPAQGRYYITKNNLPWALNISQSVPHVIEKVDFTEAYLKFVEWAISGGVTHADWYLNLPGNRNTNKIYSR
jgi:LruC domain-containing protein